MKVRFVEYRYSGETKLSRDLLKLQDPIALGATIQYLDFIKPVKEFLESHGKKVVIGRGKRTKYEGQILGCDVEALRDGKTKLVLADGRFHGIMAALKYGEAYVYNPLTGNLMHIDGTKLRKRREILKVKFKEAKNIGIIVSTKPGQFQLELARKLAKKYNAYIFVTNEVNEMINNFTFIDFWINTACPRIAIDDAEKFDKPMLNWDELCD